jgi:hypothetical protein
MAIAGGATVAYRCRLVNGTLQRDKDTAMQTPPPLPAAAAIMRGETVMVAGSDVVVVARLIELEQMVNELKESQKSRYEYQGVDRWH